jgi:hypothetical protein
VCGRWLHHRGAWLRQFAFHQQFYRLAQLNAITGHELARPGETFAVDKGAVAAAEIFQNDTATDLGELRMPPRDPGAINGDLVGRVAPKDLG